MNDGQALDILDRQQCLNLLPRVRVGRLIFFDNGDPAVHPVNFRLLRNDIVIRVAGGAKLIAALQHQKVAFQADQLDADLRKGWSVTVVGHASRPHRHRRLGDGLGQLRPTVGGGPPRSVREDLVGEGDRTSDFRRLSRRPPALVRSRSRLHSHRARHAGPVISPGRQGQRPHAADQIPDP